MTNPAESKGLKKYYIGAMFFSLTLNAALIGYSAPLAKAQAKAYAVSKLEQLTGHRTIEVDIEEDLISTKSEAMPPRIDSLKMVNNMPAARSDIIKDILNGKS